MPNSRSLAVWGDGAVGCGLAVTLSALREVVLVGPPGSGQGIAEVVSTGAYPGTATVRKVESTDSFQVDDCIIAVKAHHLGSVAGPASGSSTGACLCVSNGMGLERHWPEPPGRIEPVVLTAGFRTTGRLSVETFPGSMVASSAGGAPSVLHGSVIPLRTVEDLDPVRWGKWVVNSIINPLGALTGVANDRLLESGLEECVEILYTELVSAVPAEYRETAAMEALSMLRELLMHSSNECSMLQDVQAGRTTEIDYLTGLAANGSALERPACKCVTGLVRALGGKV